MKEVTRPNLKMMLTQEAFNTFFDMLTFFIASEAQAGETFYSYTSAKLMNQFVKYGNFIQKKNERDNLFIIYLYDSELLKIAKLYNKYVSVHQKASKNYFEQFKKGEKT